MRKYKNHRLPFFFPAVIILLASFFAVGCSDNVSSSSDANVKTSTEMDNGFVARTHFKDVPTTFAKGSTADSVVVTRARVVISKMKMHHDKDDTTGKGTIKAGPFVAEFAPNSAKLISEVSVPAGTFDRIKLEFHKLKDGIDDLLINDPIYADFLLGGRFTVVIEGMSYKGGVEKAFVFRSSTTENLQMFFDPAITLEGGKNYEIVYQYDAKALFKVGSEVLDPTDIANYSDIEKNIKVSFKVLKKEVK